MHVALSNSGVAKFARLAYFGDRDAYHDGGHKSQTTDNGIVGMLGANTLTGNPVSEMAGGCMGPLLHLEKRPYAHGSEPGFSLIL